MFFDVAVDSGYTFRFSSLDETLFFGLELPRGNEIGEFNIAGAIQRGYPNGGAAI